MDFKTDTTSVADNAIDITMFDTAGAAVVLTGGANLASAVADTWVNDHIVTSSIAGGTFTPGEYVTIRIKMTSQATTTANRNPAYVGAFKLNYTVK